MIIPANKVASNSANDTELFEEVRSSQGVSFSSFFVIFGDSDIACFYILTT